MPKPPKESTGKFSNQLKKIKKNFLNKSKCFDFMMASIIFFASIVEVISWKLQEGEQATITNVGNNYLVYYYPLTSTLVIWGFALFFFGKVTIYKSCIYSKITAYTYFLVQTISLIAIIFQIGWEAYDAIVYPILLFSIIFLTLIKLIKWGFQSH